METGDHLHTNRLQGRLINALRHRVSQALKQLRIEMRLVAEHDRQLLQQHLQNRVESYQEQPLLL